MTNLDHLCPGCMRPKTDDAKCPHCGYDYAPNSSDHLSIKTVLEDRYCVGRVLSANGEGVTYMGYDTELDSAVHIREFFPKGICTRSGDSVVTDDQHVDNFVTHKNEFLALARVLARMRNLSAIFPVYDIFEQNDTAYYVSEAAETITLRDFLVRNGGRLNFEQMCRLFMPVFSTLSSLHSVGVVHRGISPETMVIGRDGKLRLTGFCISDLRTARTDLSPELFKGYAAIEQYGFNGDSGAWTDVYSIAAVIYRTLIGSPPPDAAERVTNDRMIIPPEIAEELPAYALGALADALQILPSDRTQSIEDFRDELSAAPNVVNRSREAQSMRAEARTASTHRRKKNSNKKYIAVAAAITVIVLAIVLLILSKTVFSGNSAQPTTTGYTNSATEPDWSKQIADKNKVVVPNFKNLNASQLGSDEDSEMIAINNNFKITLERKTDDSDKGTILSQSIAAGEKVDKGTAITLVVSIGNGTVTVPNVRGMSREQALIELCKSGFMYQNIVVQEVYESGSDPEKVLEQSIAANQKVTEFANIKIKYNTYKFETTTAKPTEAPTRPATTKPATTKPAPTTTAPTNHSMAGEEGQD